MFSPGGKSLNEDMGNWDTKVGNCVGKCCRQTNSHFIDINARLKHQILGGLVGRHDNLSWDLDNEPIKFRNGSNRQIKEVENNRSKITNHG